MEQNKTIAPEEIIARLRANRFMVGIPITALVADILVRTQSDFDLAVILPLETVVFSLAGISLFFAAHSDKRISLKTYRIDMWLGLAFMLGAIRDGLWAAGMEISDVNNVDLGLGVAACVGIYFWTNRPSLRAPVREASAALGAAKAPIKATEKLQGRDSSPRQG
jgi:hypothetical protein